MLSVMMMKCGRAASQQSPMMNLIPRDIWSTAVFFHLLSPTPILIIHPPWRALRHTLPFIFLCLGSLVCVVLVLESCIKSHERSPGIFLSSVSLSRFLGNNWFHMCQLVDLTHGTFWVIRRERTLWLCNTCSWQWCLFQLFPRVSLKKPQNNCESLVHVDRTSWMHLTLWSAERGWKPVWLKRHSHFSTRLHYISSFPLGTRVALPPTPLTWPPELTCKTLCHPPSSLPSALYLPSPPPPFHISGDTTDGWPLRRL